MADMQKWNIDFEIFHALKPRRTIGTELRVLKNNMASLKMEIKEAPQQTEPKEA